MKIITTKRMVLDEQEKQIRKTWGDDWKRMKNQERKYGWFSILIGLWEKEPESEIVHVEYIPGLQARELTLATILGTNKTPVSIMARQYTIEQILTEKLERKITHKEIIDKARASMQLVYDTGLIDIIPPQNSMNKPQEQKEIHQLEESQAQPIGWWDRD